MAKKRKVRSKRSSKARSIPHFNKLKVGIALFAMVLLLIVILVKYLPEQGNVAGQAGNAGDGFTAGQDRQEGNFQHQVTSKALYGNGEPAALPSWDGANEITRYCVGSADRCVTWRLQPGPEGQERNFCFKNRGGRFVEVGKFHFCEGNDLFVCDGTPDSLGHTIENGKYVCTQHNQNDAGHGWIECTNGQEGDLEHGAYCDGNRWTTCNAESIGRPIIDQRDKVRVCTEEIGQIGIEYTWSECQAQFHNEVMGDYLCTEENEWVRFNPGPCDINGEIKKIAGDDYICEVESGWIKLGECENGQHHGQRVTTPTGQTYACGKDYTTDGTPEAWLACDAELEGKAFGKALCSSGSWELCFQDGPNDGNYVGNAYCQGNIPAWFTCAWEGQELAGRVCENEVPVQCNAEKFISSRYYCDGADLLNCVNAGNKGKLRDINGDARVCTGSVWAECTPNEEFYHGKIYNGNEQSSYCKADGSGWEVCDAARAASDDNVVGSYICHPDSEEWFECPAQGEVQNMVVGTVNGEDEGNLRFCERGSWEDCSLRNDVDCTSEEQANICTRNEHETIIGNQAPHYYCESPEEKGEWKLCPEEGHKICNLDVNGNPTRVETCNLAGDISEDGVYYCDGSTWLKCSGERMGEGVDNAPNADRYTILGDGVNRESTWVCQANRGDERGTWVNVRADSTCPADATEQFTRVGSSVVQATDVVNDIPHPYYYSESQVNCAPQEGCIWNRNLYWLDQSVEIAAGENAGKQIVCGLDHTWYLCKDTEKGEISDAGRWYCDGNEWVSCGNNKRGHLSDEDGLYKCVHDPLLDRWKWQEKNVCSRLSKFWWWSQGGETLICPGDQSPTHVCDTQRADFDLFDPSHPLHPDNTPNVDLQCVGNNIQIKELVCNNGADDDNDGLTDCEDEIDCPRNKPETIGINNDYEIIIKKSNCYNTLLSVPGATYASLKFSPDDPDGDISSALLTDPAKPINRIASIDQNQDVAGWRPEILDQGNAAFLYWEGESKQVSIMWLLHLDEQGPFNFIHTKVLQGQRILLEQDDVYYLLSHEGRDVYRPENLRLEELPIGKIHYPSRNTGRNEYIFTVQGGNEIAISPGQGNYQQITTERTAFVAAGNTQLENLHENFETTFTLNNPKRISTNDLGTLSVCSGDQGDFALDELEAKVCYHRNEPGASGVPLIALEQLLLTIYGDDEDPNILADQNNHYAFLYEYIEGQKQVSVMEIYDVRELHGEEKRAELAFNNLRASLTAGRRTVLKFDTHYYVMEHEGEQFSLKNIKLRKYGGTRDGPDGIVPLVDTYSPVGSSSRIEFTVPNGKIYIQRYYGEPQPPLRVTARTNFELRDIPIYLTQDLMTSFSNINEVRILDPVAYNLFGKTQTDRPNLPNFRVQGTGEDFNLFLNKPIMNRDRNILLHYYDISVVDGQNTKMGAAYWLFPIHRGSGDIQLTDQFMATFSQGYSFALLVKEDPLGYANKNKYYKASYTGGQIQGDAGVFQVGDIILTEITSGTEYTPQLDAEGRAVFDTQDGIIKVWVDYDDIVLRFTTRTDEALDSLTYHPDIFNYPLGPTQYLSVDGTQVRQCSTSRLAAEQGAKVCFNDDFLLVDPAVQFTPENQANTYIMEVNGELAQNKRVNIRKIVEITQQDDYHNDNWLLIKEWWQAGDGPILNISRNLYRVLMEGLALQDVSLQEFPEGRVYPMSTERIELGLYNGTITIEDQVIFFEEIDTGNDNGDELEIDINLRSYQYLDNQLEYNTQEGHFSVLVEGQVYRVNVEPRSEFLGRIYIYDSEKLLVNRKLALGESRTIYLDNTPITFRMRQLDESSANITVSR